MILNIPSVPIGVYENNNQEEHSYFINKIEYEALTEWGQRSCNKFLLDETNLKIWIESKIQDYAKLCLATNQKLLITQSWTLKNENRESKLFKHTHPNSIISGAYYLKCNNQSSHLKIEAQNCFTPERITWDKDPSLFRDQPWLWQYFSYPPKIGRLYLFPSNLTHYVDPEIDNDTRCVLSFNTWFNDPIGNVENLTFLGI